MSNQKTIDKENNSLEYKISNAYQRYNEFIITLSHAHDRTDFESKVILSFLQSLKDYVSSVIDHTLSHSLKPFYENLLETQGSVSNYDTVTTDKHRTLNHNSLILNLGMVNKIWLKHGTPPNGGLYSLDPRDIYPLNKSIKEGIDLEYIASHGSRSKIGDWALYLLAGIYEHRIK